MYASIYVHSHFLSVNHRIYYDQIDKIYVLVMTAREIIFLNLKIYPYFSQKSQKICFNVLQINNSNDFDYICIKIRSYRSSTVKSC